VRIAVDGRRLQDRPPGGVGRYVAQLVVRVAAGQEVVVLTDARRDPPTADGIARLARPLAVPRGRGEAPWLHVAASRWLRDWDGLFHGTFNQLPFRCPVPSVVTIHDLSFEHHPEDFTVPARRWFQLQARRAVSRARVVVTPTEVVRRDVIASYGVAPARVLVTPNAADSIFHPRRCSELDAGLASLGLHRPYLVAVGGAPRRGLEVAIGAWRESGAADRGVGLAVIGGDGRRADRPGPTWLGALDDEALATVIAGAEALCYPTRYEGFGLPALEAAASGTPAVCARIPALVEVLGPAAEWCAEPTVPAIAAGLRRLLGSPARRAELAEAALARAAAVPTWDDMGRATLDAYRLAMP
jgi:glycosyltransferase involved in cell wall biosynthesis